MLVFYRALIALRRRLAPLANGRKDLTRVETDEAGRWVTIRRGDPSGAATLTVANLGDRNVRIRVPLEAAGWRLCLATGAAPDVPELGVATAVLVVPPAIALIFESGA